MPIVPDSIWEKGLLLWYWKQPKVQKNGVQNPLLCCRDGVMRATLSIKQPHQKMVKVHFFL